MKYYSITTIAIAALSLSGCVSSPAPQTSSARPSSYSYQKSTLPAYSDDQLDALGIEALVEIAKKDWLLPGTVSSQDRDTAKRASKVLSKKVEGFSQQELLLLIKRQPPYNHGVWIDASKKARDVYLVKSGWPEEIKAVIRDRSAQIGMTSDQVLVSLGLPERVNTSSGRYGTREQWVYDYSSGPAYLYFEEGVLSSWQSSKKQ